MSEQLNFSEGSTGEAFPLRIGETIRDTTAFGRHLVVIDVLGQGAYAVVYLVKDVKTGQQHALKCLSKSGLSWEQLNIQREEAKLHKSIGKHANIVHLDRYFENKNWLFLVLEYCPGRDLFCWISEHCDEFTLDGRPRSTEERYRVIKDIFAQALAAVQYCHTRGIYHRDIKPENFIVCRDGVLKLADFGLATSDKESDDFDCGSRPYMSHECLIPCDQTYSPRLADVWSLGILILTLLYRRTPWSEASDDCPKYVRYMKSPTRFLQQEYGCDAMLASFLVRRVFCPASQGRVSVADWLRMWYDDLILPKSSGSSRAPVSRREIPDVNRLKQLLTDIQVTQSLPEESRLPAPKSFAFGDALSVKPQPMLRRKSSWADLADDEVMDFSAPLVFEDQFPSTLVTPIATTRDASTDSTVVPSPVEIKHAASAIPLIHVESASMDGSWADSAFGSSSTVSSHLQSFREESHPTLIKAFAFERKRFGFESRSTGGIIGYDSQEFEDDGLVFSMD